MRYPALLVAAFITVVGITGVFAPDRLFENGRYVATPGGLYAIAAIRLAVGVVLLLVAQRSRTPRLLRTLGAIVLVAGLATPLFGVERTRAILDWESTQGTGLIRAGAVLALALGGFLAFAVTPARRTV
jgi:ribose/xylose/arabinose/galactoside ABC-type transport system permease subunit